MCYATGEGSNILSKNLLNHRLKIMGRKLKSSSLKYNNHRCFSKYIVLILSVVITAIMSCACAQKQAEETPAVAPAPEQVQTQEQSVNVPGENETKGASVDLDVEEDVSRASRLVSYDVTSIGRSDPFMPYGEYQTFEQIKKDSIAEANAHNAEVMRIRQLEFQAVREEDDISPYSFNLPVPPTELASDDSAAARITKTKVVGIMYNEQSPSAIINVDDKDYLVRPGDKIIGQEYSVSKINPTWITVSLGHNVYSAAVGEQFSKDEIIEHTNDIYDLKHRFGGRKG